MLNFRTFLENFNPKQPVHAIGDIHGMYEAMIHALKNQGLVDDKEQWAGKNSTLVFTGDLMDRGPQGIEVLRKVRELQEQAKAQGGEVVALLGNHDIYFFCLARLLRQKKMIDQLSAMTIPRDADVDAMVKSGAIKTEDKDQEQLMDAIAEMGGNGLDFSELVELAKDRDLLVWCLSFPLMAEKGGILFQHVNGSTPYKQLLEKANTEPDRFQGNNIEKVNKMGESFMMGSNLPQAGWFFNHFTSDESREWESNYYHMLHSTKKTDRQVEDHLKLFAPTAKKVAHGHTQHNQEKPIEYANGKAVNLDVGLAYHGKDKSLSGNRMYDFTDTGEPEPTDAPAAVDPVKSPTPVKPPVPARVDPVKFPTPVKPVLAPAARNTPPMSTPAARNTPPARNATPVSTPVAATATARPRTQPMTSALAQDLDKTFDYWMMNLKQSLLAMTPPDQQRGLWDRFKNWTSNMWYGRYNQTNPYFWNNKLGDLGTQTEATQPEYLTVCRIMEEMEAAYVKRRGITFRRCADELRPYFTIDTTEKE